MSRRGRRSLRASQLPTPSPRSATRPKARRSAAREHTLSDVPHRLELLFRSLARRLARGSAPRRPSSCRSRVALSRARARIRLSRGTRPVRPGVSPPHCASAQAVSGFSPSTVLALSRRHRERRARQARSPRLAAARTGRSRGSVVSSSLRHRERRRGDPGRHRPMSATHDSFIKTGTLRPGTLRSVFPHLAVARASRRPSQSRRARPRHGCIVLTRSVFARTEDASSPAGSPAERDSRVHRRRPAAHALTRTSSGLPPMV